MRAKLTILALGTAICFILSIPSTAQTDNRPMLRNNTSGCDNDQNADSGGPCSGVFVGMFDNNPAGTGRLQGDGEYNAAVTEIAEESSEAAAGMVSKLDLHQLLYSGNQTLILAGYEPWFTICHYNGPFQTTYPVPATQPTFPAGGYGTCNNHVEAGYDAVDASYFTQLQNMADRGFNGVIIDWYGQAHTHEDNVTQGLRFWDTKNFCLGMQQCTLYHALMEDQGSWDGDCPPAATTDQTNCVMTHLEADFDYMNATYFSYTGLGEDGVTESQSYLKIAPTGPSTNPWQVSSAGRPVVFLFIAQSEWKYPTGSPNAGQPNVDWNTVWNAVRSHLQTFGQNEPYLIFELGNSFSHTLYPQSDGGFGWIGHWTGDSTNCSFTPTSDPEGLCLLYHFYKSAASATESWNTSLPMITFGSAWKGFDNTYAGWRESVAANANVASIIPQHCGRTWLDTFARANAAFSTAKQLPFLQVATWNDYDEGHEIETGIENCWSVTASLPPGSSTINWSLQVAPVQPNAATDATLATVDHFEIASNGVTLASVPATATSFDLATLHLGSGTYEFEVVEVSKPSIRNQVSSKLPYTVP